MKRVLLAILLAAALCAGCAAGGQAPVPETSTMPEPESPSSVSEPAPEPESMPEPPASESESVPEPTPEPESVPESAPVPESSSVSEEPFQSEEPASDPNAIYQNPDTAAFDENLNTPEAKQVIARGKALEKELEESMPKEIYCRFAIFCQGKVELQISTNDEKALDEFLANWQGTEWDELKKEPADYSRAEAEALAKKIADYRYDFGPGAVCTVMEINGYVWVSVEFQKDEDVIISLPREIARLAEEAGLSEIVRYAPNVNGERPSIRGTPGVNYDT